MVHDDIEREARELEQAARYHIHAAAHEADQEGRLRVAADGCARLAVQDMGTANGLALRAAELRYDARGGMTAALERRRFEAGARWTTRWSPGEVFTVRYQREPHDGPWVHFDMCWPERLALMTRENGWLFLGLSDQGGYR